MSLAGKGSIVYGEVSNMTMSTTEIEKKYGISAAKLDEIDEKASRGELPGEPDPVSVGRLLKFGTALKKEAAELRGMSFSTFMRMCMMSELAKRNQ